MIWKTIHDDQLFVYRNGELIYKKWFKTGRSCVMNSYGPPSWNGDRHENVDNEEAR